MQNGHPTYTKEFKVEAVKLVETSGKSKSQIAQDLGISDSSLRSRRHAQRCWIGWTANHT